MSLRIVALFAASVLAPAAFAQEAADAKKVIEAAVKAHGGAENLAKYKAGVSDFKGDISIADMDLGFKGKVTHEVPNKFHMEITVEVAGVKQTITQVVNGKLVTMSVNGMPQKVSDAQKAELMRAPIMQEISQLTPLLDGKKYTVEAEKAADVDGKPADVVRVQGKELGVDVRLYFDKTTHLLVKTSRTALSPDEKEVKEESIQSDFKDVSGVKVPMKVLVNHDGKKFMSIEITDAKVMEKADPALFKSDL